MPVAHKFHRYTLHTVYASEICVYLTKIFSQNQVQKDSWSTLQKGERLEFTHLHVHTEYSLLDGSNKIKEYVARVKELGMDSAAITDHGVMYGVIDFYREAKAAGINPILGCEVYVAPNSRLDREIGSDEDRYYHHGAAGRK